MLTHRCKMSYNWGPGSTGAHPVLKPSCSKKRMRGIWSSMSLIIAPPIMNSSTGANSCTTREIRVAVPKAESAFLWC